MAKPLFFALEVAMPKLDLELCEHLRKIQDRHITLAFLGTVDKEKALAVCKKLPLLKDCLCGIFSSIQLLPKKHPRCLSLIADWLTPFTPFYESVIDRLQTDGLYLPSGRTFKAHTTIYRGKIDKKKIPPFSMIPFYAPSLTLFQSEGFSRYTPLYKIPLLIPFQEISHTADIAYVVSAQSIASLFIHAKLALFFSFPELIPYTVETKVETIDDIVRALNQIISHADADVGAGVKAVSYHGAYTKNNTTLFWEMILDV